LAQAEILPQQSIFADHLEQIPHSALLHLMVAVAAVRGQILEQRTTALLAVQAAVVLI
jgi:hypothetical protein